MGFHHTRAARERRKKEGRKYSAYESAVRMLRSLSIMDKMGTTAGNDGVTTKHETTTEQVKVRKAPPPYGYGKTRAGNLVITVEIDKEAQDQMIRRKRKSLAQRLKERMMTRRVEPHDDSNDDDEDDDDEHGRNRRGGCFGC